MHALHPVDGVPTHVRGIDVGTGSVAIYAVLACAKNPGWTVVGTDVDEEALSHARKVLEDDANNAVATGSERRLRERIQLVHTRGALLGELVPPAGDATPHTHPRYHFTMCNPPFYASPEERQASTDAKKAARAWAEGHPHELYTPGGEAGFVLQLLEESLVTREQIVYVPRSPSWYTTMLGKLASVHTLIHALRRAQVRAPLTRSRTTPRPSSCRGRRSGGPSRGRSAAAACRTQSRAACRPSRRRRRSVCCVRRASWTSTARRARCVRFSHRSRRSPRTPSRCAAPTSTSRSTCTARAGRAARGASAHGTSTTPRRAPRAAHAPGRCSPWTSRGTRGRCVCAGRTGWSACSLSRLRCISSVRSGGGYRLQRVVRERIGSARLDRGARGAALLDHVLDLGERRARTKNSPAL